MDCCNYVQPYAGTGPPFYPQHHLFYENGGYGGYGPAPVSALFQANDFRYRLPTAYSTDYVYNPKEARLRKAMREQNREVSRQGILQNEEASTSGENEVVASTGNFSNQALPCASSLSGGPWINANRIISPWFPVGHAAAPTSHLKSILTPRVMAAHQRTIDETKDVIRKQLECGATGAFSGVLSPNCEFSPRNGGQENNDYCVIPEFAEGQKWHPYQNASNPYHSRLTTVAKVGNVRNVPNPSPHRPPHWPQFCGITTPNVMQNFSVQHSRQMAFLQEQQNQHCNYSEEMQQRYATNKADVNPQMHLSYRQDNHQFIPDGPFSTSEQPFFYNYLPHIPSFMDQRQLAQLVPESCCCAKNIFLGSGDETTNKQDCLQVVFRFDESWKSWKACGLVYNHAHPKCRCRDKSLRSRASREETKPVEGNETLSEEALDLRLPERKNSPKSQTKTEY